MAQDPFDGSPDVHVPHHRFKPDLVRRLWTMHVLGRNSSVLAESGVSVLGNLAESDIQSDFPFLTDWGIHIGMVFHGTDIRDPCKHMANVEHSHYRYMDSAWTERVRIVRERNARITRETDIPVFVSTPDLTLDVPSAQWLPLVIDTEQWKFAQDDYVPSSRPRVLFRPSQAVLKGEEFIAPILQELAQKQLIFLVMPGPVRQSEMPALVKGVDIVVDQVLVGSYGVAACESMAAGKITVGYVTSDVRAAIGTPLPIFDAPPKSFKDTMLNLLEDLPEAWKIAQKGPDFVRTWHNGEASAKVLKNFLRRNHSDDS